MASGELAALAELAAQTVVAAAVTDVWEKAKQGLARLLSCGDPGREEAAARRLDVSRAELSGAAGVDMERVQAQVAAVWRVRLGDLLEDDPGLAAGLQEQVAQIRVMLPAGPVSAGDHSLAAGGNVSITASGGGVAAGVIHGGVAPPDPTPPGGTRG